MHWRRCILCIEERDFIEQNIMIVVSVSWHVCIDIVAIFFENENDHIKRTLYEL